jgi:hypothetical protein
MINGFGIPTQPEVLVMMFGQRSNKLQERLGGGRLGPDVVFCLDQCDALAMHSGHAKLGLPCQSASPANSYSCRRWRELSSVILNETRADLSYGGDAEAFS